MIKVGKYTYGKENIKLYHYGNKNISEIIIGKYCSISTNVKMFLNENHRIDWITTYPFGHLYEEKFYNYNKDNIFLESMSKGNGNIIIGNDVWIGDSVTIMSGVNIGDGSVIAANSHVVKNVEPYSVVGGNPSKFIKYRFDKKTIEKLLEIKWWDLDEDIINNNLKLLMSNNIEEFIENLYSSRI